ncbi:flagellar basal body protein [Kluyvera sichuanensis]
MSISFDRALGVHPQALQLRLTRAELLSTNLANVDTPNFKAKDINFAAEMQRADRAFIADSRLQTKFRLPYQPSHDGNTVELNVEQAAFAQNSMDYQTSLTFLKMKFSGLKAAIEGK